MKRMSSEEASTVTPGGGSKRQRGRHGGQSCKPCAVWRVMGSSPEFEHLHKMSSPGHPNTKASSFSAYLSVHGETIELEPLSCLRNACYVDAQKHHEDLTYQKGPRWTAIHHSKPALQKHCPACHAEMDNTATSSCACSNASRWVTSVIWEQGEDHKLWEIYFQKTRNKKVHLKHANMCKKHYMELYRIKK